MCSSSYFTHYNKVFLFLHKMNRSPTFIICVILDRVGKRLIRIKSTYQARTICTAYIEPFFAHVKSGKTARKNRHCVIIAFYVYVGKDYNFWAANFHSSHSKTTNGC